MIGASKIRHVRQTDPYGCAIACVAMVTGQSYETVRHEWGHVGKGHDWLKWTTYLMNRGYAVQHLWKHDSERKADRPVWPLEPWADVHLCAVDAGHGDGSHLVVLLRDGTVLDPATDAPRRMSDYASVLHMTAVAPMAILADRDRALAELRGRAEAARDDALEEAARIADDMPKWVSVPGQYEEVGERSFSVSRPTTFADAAQRIRAARAARAADGGRDAG